MLVVVSLCMSIVLELVVACVWCSVAVQVQIAHYSLPWLWTALTSFYLLMQKSSSRSERAIHEEDICNRRC